MFNFFRGFAAQDAPPDSKANDSYFEKLLKYIPADIVAGYVAIAGILQEHNNDPLWVTWAVFGILLVLTPFYVCYVKTDPPGFHQKKLFHWVTACLAFTAWVFALGGPFAATFAWYKPYLGSVVLILTTLIIPVLEGRFVAGPNNGSGNDPGNGSGPTPDPAPTPSPSPEPAPAPPTSPNGQDVPPAPHS